MRFLIISDAWKPQINGVVRTYEHVTAALTAQGHTVKVIGPEQFRTLPAPGYAEIRLALCPKRRLQKHIQDFAPDCIHIAVEGPLGWAARAYCLRQHIPFTTAYHTQFPQYIETRLRFLGNSIAAIGRRLAAAWVRRFHAPSACVFVTTPSMMQALRAMGFMCPMHLLSRGVDTTVFSPDGERLFQDLPKPIHLYVGRIAAEKNLAAFLSLPLAGSKVVVGRGPDEDMLRQKFPNVHFCGLQEGHALAAHYRSADVFVFPSKTDTFGIVLIEAMASGLPIAGFKVPGPKDIITDPSLGAMDDDLSTAIAKALQYPGNRQSRFAHAAQTYSWDEIARQFAAESSIHRIHEPTP